MIHNLSSSQFIALLRSVFSLAPKERDLTLFVDLPDGESTDNVAWMDRRRIATEWYALLRPHLPGLPFSAINYCAYPNVKSNNNDLPEFVERVDRTSGDAVTSQPEKVSLLELLKGSSVVLSLTEYSATAPLKNLARELQFRGATLPGFTRSMIPALGLDFGKIHARVMELKLRMDRAESALARFLADGKSYALTMDLRFTTAHASGGLMREPGVVANLPSGEAYIVPFEGGDTPSMTAGVLPVQFGDEVVLFKVEENKAIAVLSDGPESHAQATKLAIEPAYGNIAELGIGILGEWGVQASGSILLDEKLGVHIAFGRSEHFGGKTGPAQFRDPNNVIHIDWVYVPSVQPRVTVDSLVFSYADGKTERIIDNGKTVI